MPARKKFTFLIFTCLLAVALSTINCGIYKFTDASVDPKFKSVKINYIENRAPYVNPQLSPTLTDRLRQKIVNQTRLSQTNGDNAHLDIKGEVRDYSVVTSGITSTGSGNQRQASINRLSVTVHITLTNQLEPETTPKEFDVSRNFEFSANISLQTAEAQLLDEIVRNLTDDIFNRLFSDW
ncbi:MAG TPA: LptE family protein [Chitinophagaceae bacterium]|nr:LptE family protein [Chitinophagaceae bacterium]